ncbi:MAG: hypothetical protein OQK09_14480 [Colwellia sp.]|nr:hypothetical protein [Colwellia sp.]MCW8865286.1 hypothetical protein [Colwellia sp.]MCW9082714.1 hypothetical protein [Colwellia sp.]
MNKQANVESITDQVLADKVNSLPDEMTPERDLWAGIERAIQAKPQQSTSEFVVDDSKRKYFTPTAWAASVVAAVLVTWLSFSPVEEQVKPLTAQTSEANQPSNKTVVNDELVAMIQNNFTEQRQAMLVSFGQPDLKQLPLKMQTQLTQLAQARLAIEKALQNDKNNVDLLNLLRFTQQQELNLLQQLLPLTGSQAPKWQTI